MVSPWLWKIKHLFLYQHYQHLYRKLLQVLCLFHQLFCEKLLELHGLVRDLLNLHICATVKAKRLCRLYLSLSSVCLVTVAMSFTAVQAENPGSTGWSLALALSACIAASAISAEAQSVGQWSTDVGYCYIDDNRLLKCFAGSVEESGEMTEAAFVSPRMNVSSLGCADYLNCCHWAGLCTVEHRANPRGLACSQNVIIK